MSKLTLICLLAVVSVTSCGNSGPSADQACTDQAQARCTKRMTCTGGVGITRTWGDMNTCLAREKLSCTIGLAAPLTGNSPVLVEQCVAAFPTYSCANFLNGNPPAACIVTGPKAANAVCAFAGQCSTTYCNSNKTSACGTCGPAPTAGSSCTSSNCARDQECVASTMMCQALGVSGTACNSTTPCGADLSCVGATMTSMGTCMVPAATAGMACGGTTPGCDGTMGLYCGGMVGSKTCMTISYVGNGMPCGTLTDGSFVGCSGGGACYTSTGLAGSGEMGTCKAPAADNMPCDTIVGPPCLTPARCIVAGGTSGTCTVPTGSTCG